MLIKIDSNNPQERLINKIVDILKKGGIIAYPTDTMYGIGCNIMNKKAIEKIYQIKQCKKDTPFSFICSGLKNISDYAKVTNFSYKIIKHLLPGPYTFILEASKLVPKIIITKRKTVGIRIPDNKICMAIINKMGNPIISTTATTTENTYILDSSFIHDYFGHNLDAVIDGGVIPPGTPSSVISLINDEPEVLRKGIGTTSIFEC